ncbi:MAG: hypothetical protein ABI548_25775 [Polyangiaceae bacterium]
MNDHPEDPPSTRNLARRIAELFTQVVRASMNSSSAAEEARRVSEKYSGLPTDELAQRLITRAARKTKWEGAANGLAVTGCELVALSPVPEPTHKAAAGAGAVALLLADVAFATRTQMQLLLAIAALYDCPFDPDDEEDAYVIFKAALGLKGTERVGSYGRFIFTETARKQFRKLLRTGVRRAVQDFVVKAAGPRIGIYLSEKYVMRVLPVLNAGLGYWFNNAITKSVGRWAKVRAKIRSSAFRHAEFIAADDPEALVWVLPTIFLVGTAADHLTESVLTLYSQCAKRLPLTDEQQTRLARLLDAEDLPQILAEEMPRIRSAASRRALYDIALTTAAANLNPAPQERECIREVASWLELPYIPENLDARVRYLQR